MIPQVIVRSQPAKRPQRRRVGEMAGGATAECAAVCCCCPCAVLNFVVLAVYTVPKGLVRKAAHRRRCRLMKNGVNCKKNGVVMLQQQSAVASDIATSPTVPLEDYLAKERAAEENSEAVALEIEMWARFAGTGFWRSESQREPITVINR
ncbi:hypothetical protein SESBI_34686 [Sesbania bispinosa]|nr:hypothetical protein SESBI_34686 [Sesbania bispinosa]